MVIGLGAGSTAIHATHRIAILLHQGTLRKIVGFATSRAVLAEAVRLGIPMLSEDRPSAIDLTIDGADEIDPALLGLADDVIVAGPGGIQHLQRASA
jgi:ribose 5-phosphate isomerase A